MENQLSFVSYQELCEIIGCAQKQPKKNLERQWNEKEKLKFQRFLRTNKKISKNREFFQFLSEYIQTKSFFQCRKYYRRQVQHYLKKKREQFMQNCEILYCFKPVSKEFQIVKTKTGIRIRKNPEFKEEQQDNTKDV